MLHLTPRLQTVADRVPVGVRLVDVGTDHAYLPTWLLLQERIPFALCTDLRPGPLERARETVERWDVAKRTELRLCNGLAGVSAEEVDVIAIAGMGGETILTILTAAPWARDKALVVQPMSSLADLRSGLAPLGLHIVKETLAQEGETLYVVMDLAPGAEGPMTAAERQVGRAERHREDPLWPLYLCQEEGRLKKALRGLERSHKPEDASRRGELSETLEGIQRMMEES